MEDNQKKRPRDRSGNRILFRRTLILMGICGMLIFIPVLWKLWNLQVTQKDELQEKAATQQTSSRSSTAYRGSIYDTNGNTLATSTAAYDVIISPKAIAEKQKELDEQKEKYEKKGDTEKAAEYDLNVEDLVVEEMVKLFDADSTTLHEKCQNTSSQYVRIAQQIDGDTLTELRSFMEEYSFGDSIYLQLNAKRVYPYSSLASQIIGFTNTEGGANGLEKTFDSDLTGTPGLTVTSKDSSGRDLLNFYQDKYDAEDGSDLYLTIDTNIQTICETKLQEAIEKYDVLEGGVAIAMRCSDGAILGMASSPTYDLNNYSTVIDQTLLDKVDTLTQEYVEQGEDETTAKQKAMSELVLTQWRNKAVNDTYEPGSTIKSVVLAAALEEGVTNVNDTFTCTGSIDVADYTISCSSRRGHGLQDLATAVGHSCNPAFVTLGQRLGTDKFYEYMEAFGILDEDGNATSTGIDLPGESTSLFWSKDSFNIVNLATASFGQRFNVTPIQLITAFNAVINGGYYYQPYVVSSVKDADGNVTYSADTTALRQVISESTSETCREILEGVVSNGLTGKNAYRAGYRIGGKTGTSQTLKDVDGDGANEHIVSFVGFAPADDPEIIVLVMLDSPKNVSGDEKNAVSADGTSIGGGTMAAPVVGDIIQEVLDYMDYGKQYTADEMEGSDALVPYMDGYNVKQAKSVAKEFGFTLKVVGDDSDDTAVATQTPAGGSYIPSGSEIVIYTGDSTPPDSVTVPDLTGMNPTEAQNALESVGLYMKATGASKYYNSNTLASGQSSAAGTEVSPGTVVTVTFTDTTSDGDETAGIN
jgi:stage V sporulation protein D (sporulation-specific penicillin-binding protein)